MMQWAVFSTDLASRGFCERGDAQMHGVQSWIRMQTSADVAWKIDNVDKSCLWDKSSHSRTFGAAISYISRSVQLQHCLEPSSSWPPWLLHYYHYMFIRNKSATHGSNRINRKAYITIQFACRLTTPLLRSANIWDPLGATDNDCSGGCAAKRKNSWDDWTFGMHTWPVFDWTTMWVN